MILPNKEEWDTPKSRKYYLVGLSCLLTNGFYKNKTCALVSLNEFGFKSPFLHGAQCDFPPCSTTTGRGRLTLNAQKPEAEDGVASRAEGRDSSYGKPQVVPALPAPSGPKRSSGSLPNTELSGRRKRSRTAKTKENSLTNTAEWWRRMISAVIRSYTGGSAETKGPDLAWGCGQERHRFLSFQTVTLRYQCRIFKHLMSSWCPQGVEALVQNCCFPETFAFMSCFISLFSFFATFGGVRRVKISQVHIVWKLKL